MTKFTTLEGDVSAKDVAKLRGFADRVMKGDTPTQRSNWRPIETAPRDGTPVLLFADCHGWRGNFARVTGAFYQGQWRQYGPILGEPTSDGRERQWFAELLPIKWKPLDDARPQWTREDLIDVIIEIIELTHAKTERDDEHYARNIVDWIDQNLMPIPDAER